jgi:dihydroanticapsin dehydrogenase
MLAPTTELVLLDLDAERLEDARASVRERGGDAVCVSCDVRDAAACSQQITDAIQGTGLDDVVSCAGLVAGDGPLLESGPDVWERLLGVNLIGVANVVRAALPSLLEAGGGDIVLVGSLAAIHGRRRVSAYSACKAGLVGLTRSLVADYGRDGVRANCVCPGSTATPMSTAPNPVIHNTLGRRAQPEEIAAVIAWLVDDASNWVNGAVLPADAGESAVGTQFT